MVPRGGIEPPTQGFSIPCSTPELPGHALVFRFILTRRYLSTYVLYIRCAPRA